VNPQCEPGSKPIFNTPVVLEETAHVTCETFHPTCPTYKRGVKSRHQRCGRQRGVGTCSGSPPVATGVRIFRKFYHHQRVVVPRFATTRNGVGNGHTRVWGGARRSGGRRCPTTVCTRIRRNYLVSVHPAMCRCNANNAVVFCTAKRNGPVCPTLRSGRCARWGVRTCA